jgi:hypothetical protein
MHTRQLLIAALSAGTFACGAALAQTTTPAPDAAAPGKSPTPAEIVNAAPPAATGTTAPADTPMAAPASDAKTEAKADAKSDTTKATKTKGKSKRKHAKPAPANPQ